jgi:hypothetical protein
MKQARGRSRLLTFSIIYVLENGDTQFCHLSYCEFRRRAMASCTTVGFNKFHRDSKNHAERPWFLILLSDKNCALRDEASNSTSAAGTNPGKIQLVILNSLTSGISLGQSFQDGYPLLPTTTGAGSTAAGMTEN